ncbi:AGZA family xanthine/uracil permease-like MFS transporter [Caldalkalibacillus uzonensis]|uniref:AGZA family xanthine/uracil permease-like MFS transporter n=1 Tax=Caldalkalibacillus uzonensis TaxID=353224 RepID=A0ABU0CVG9_9BACI|nr:NCS2 family permease [Caldalkalibacillus uzonensis]MDQ0340419.1 AGZA family xanthine/uracil permease-like MFS transporter [Caldalkalibacillus uzonensis]
MERYFEFEKHNTSYRQEFIAGLTTFLAMAYILFVNAFILADAGMDPGAVFVATALASALGCLIMGLWAKYPIALAPGMGLNAFFAYTVVLGMGIPWQAALAGVMVSGLIFFILTLTKVRETIINAIPLQLKLAAGAGIGFFIAFIGMQNAGIIVADEVTLVQLGELMTPSTLLAIFGLVITALFMIRGFKGGIFYGMILTALAGMVVGIVSMPSAIVSSIPSLAPTFGAAIAYPLSHPEQFFTAQMLVVIFTFLFVDFFDTAGTLMAVANQAGFLKNNKLPRASRALSSDSVATVVGAVLGTSTTTSYIESSAGVAAGGRTGFTSVVVAGLFLVALFFSPLLEIFLENPGLTSPALIIVGVLMAGALGSIEWNKLEFALPAFVTIIAMPLTYSIATGIALGFIMYPLTKIFKGEYKDVHPIMYVMFFIFLAYFIWLVE